jgi:hypothetical protein
MTHLDQLMTRLKQADEMPNGYSNKHLLPSKVHLETEAHTKFAAL